MREVSGLVWEVVRRVDIPAAIYLLGSAHDGPDAVPRLCFSSDEVRRVYGAEITFSFRLVSGQTSVSLPVPAAPRGLLSLSLPLESAVLRTDRLDFAPARLSGQCTVRYVALPDRVGYLPAAAEALFAAGARALVCVRLPGIRASAVGDGWRVQARYSGGRYNGVVVRYSHGELVVTDIDGSVRSVPCTGWEESLTALRHSSDFPVWLERVEPGAVLEDGMQWVLGGGVAASYTQESLIELAGLLDLPWPGVVVPCGGVGREAALALYALRSGSSVPLCYSFNLWEAVESLPGLPPRYLFGRVDPGLPRSALFGDSCVAGAYTVFVRRTGLDDYARIALPDTSCPPLPIPSGAQDAVVVDTGEPMRWVVTGHVDTAHGWLFGSGSGAIELSYPVPGSYLKVSHTLALSSVSLPDRAYTGIEVVGARGLLVDWGGLRVCFGQVAVTTPQRPGQVLVWTLPFLVSEQGVPVLQQAVVDRLSQWGTLSTSLVLWIEVGSGQFCYGIEDAGARRYTGDYLSMPAGFDGVYRLSWYEWGQPFSSQFSVRVRRIFSGFTSGVGSVDLATPVLDMGEARRVSVSVNATNGYQLLECRHSDLPFDRLGLTPPWRSFDRNVSARYWQFRLRFSADTLVQSVTVTAQ